MLAMKALVPQNPLVVLVCMLVLPTIHVRAEDAKLFKQQLKDAKSVVQEKLSIIGKPAPGNPFNKETQAQDYAIFHMRFEDKALWDMDQAVKDLIFQQFQEGKSLSDIISSTHDEVGWSEWPAALTESRLEEIPGVTDAKMTDEEWLAESNEVVIIYRSFHDESGIELHFLQNSFRATHKHAIRGCPSLYVVLKMPTGQAYLGNLYTRDYPSIRGASDAGWIPRLLDIWQETPGEVPSILVYYGPQSHILALEISHYVWNPDAHLWEGVGLWLGETIVEFKYDPQITTLTYYTGYMVDPLDEEGSNVLAPPQTVNLKEKYIRDGAEIEKYRKKNVLKQSPLSPPKEKYLKTPAESQTPKVPAPAK
ncbi:MAG: hypothetical protein HYV26_18490 [Candidatus Hydrogenedentes bacterium]|nr:hypothetical protein [Candidatus Hydrogenedentota bacterium]